MNPDHKPFSAACQRNREPILAVLRPLLASRRRVLEVGSGTGQHALHFAAAMPWLTWQTSDRQANLAGIRLGLDEVALANTPPPRALDVNQSDWPSGPFDAVFSANTLHIMAWREVEALLRRLPTCLAAEAVLAIYGPWHVDGRATSASNAAFDAELRARAAHMGIRDVAAVDALAAEVGFELLADHPMPANNRLRVWRRLAR